jgi:hypothetical protein
MQGEGHQSSEPDLLSWEKSWFDCSRRRRGRIEVAFLSGVHRRLRSSGDFLGLLDAPIRSDVAFSWIDLLVSES